MDKQTLSNYGWIVITVLVLAVMLALATPFGEFIAGGFKATYTGFSHVTDKALGVIGLGGNGGSGETGGEQGGTETPETPNRKLIYRIEFDWGSPIFDVYDDSPNTAELVVFSGMDSSEKFGSCECTPDNAQKGWSYDLVNGSVTCPCGGYTKTDATSVFDYSCTHEGATFEVLSKETENHELMCNICQNYLNTVVEAHYDNNGDNACDVCGYINAENCSHINGGYIKNLNGTHNFECSDCLSNEYNVDCNFVDGACVDCNAKDPATCAHENTYGNNNDNGTHDVVCDDCGSTTITGETHTDNNGDGSCDVCGYTAPIDPATCPHEETSAYNCWDGTHNVFCNRCGTDIITGEAHSDSDNDGYCDACWEYLG